jgi:hypothetical protein
MRLHCYQQNNKFETQIMQISGRWLEVFTTTTCSIRISNCNLSLDNSKNHNYDLNKTFLWQTPPYPFQKLNRQMSKPGNHIITLGTKISYHINMPASIYMTDHLLFISTTRTHKMENNMMLLPVIKLCCHPEFIFCSVPSVTNSMEQGPF